jgi:hypothetical protein
VVSHQARTGRGRAWFRRKSFSHDLVTFCAVGQASGRLTTASRICPAAAEQETRHAHRLQLGKQVPGPFREIPTSEFLVVSQTVEQARTHIAVIPAGLLARATRTVISGTPIPRLGRINITHFSKIAGLTFPAAREACSSNRDELSLVLH